MGQQAPLTAGPQQVQQRVHHFPEVQRTAPSGPGGAGQQRLNQGPLGVGQIGRLGPARFHTRYRSCTSGSLPALVQTGCLALPHSLTLFSNALLGILVFRGR
jgi:hypothetical protein